MRSFALSAIFPVPVFSSGPLLASTMFLFSPVSHRIHLRTRHGDIYKLGESAINTNQSLGKCTISDEFGDDCKRFECLGYV